MEIDKIIPLCHSCHNFIHSGRLQMLLADPLKFTFDREKVSDILQQGLDILASNDLGARWYTIDLAYNLDIDHKCSTITEPVNVQMADWDKWRMILEGKEYFSKFDNYEHWKSYYSTR